MAGAVCEAQGRCFAEWLPEVFERSLMTAARGARTALVPATLPVHPVALERSPTRPLRMALHGPGPDAQPLLQNVGQRIRGRLP